MFCVYVLCLPFWKCSLRLFFLLLQEDEKQTIVIHSRAQSGLTAAEWVDAFSDSNVVVAVSFNYAPVLGTHTTHTHTQNIHTFTFTHTRAEENRQTVGTLDVDIASLQRPKNIFCVFLSSRNACREGGWVVQWVGRLSSAPPPPIPHVLGRVIYLTDTFFCVDCIVIPT